MNVSRKINEHAKKHGLDVNKTQITFALERLVARLENDPVLAKSLVYKGGFVLLKSINSDRYTVDVDALAHSLSENEARERVLSAVSVALEDGIAFGDAKVSAIDVESEGYGGIRLKVRFQLDVPVMHTDKLSRRTLIHLDIAFGEYLPGKLTKQNLPTLLEEPVFNVSWSIFPLEFIFAEKLQTMVSRGPANSRAKDLYDMSLLSQQIKDSTKLVRAVEVVFAKRETGLPNLSQFMSSLDTDLLRRSWSAVKLKQEASFDDTFFNLSSFLGKTFKSQ